MGTAQSTSKQPVLVTAAMANYMDISKDQMIKIRDTCLRLAADDDTISRRAFHMAVSKARVVIDPDGDILDCLFTLFDKSGYGRVNVQTFTIAISPLACSDGLEEVFAFAMEVLDWDETDKINSRELMLLLKSKCIEDDDSVNHVCRWSLVSHV